MGRIRSTSAARRLRAYLGAADALVRSAEREGESAATIHRYGSLKREAVYARLRQWQHLENKGRSDVSIAFHDDPWATNAPIRVLLSRNSWPRRNTASPYMINPCEYRSLRRKRGGINV